MIPSGLLAAAMLDEPALYQHLDVPLDGLGWNSRLRLDSRHFQAGIGLDAVENSLLTLV